MSTALQWATKHKIILVNSIALDKARILINRGYAVFIIGARKADVVK